MLMKGEYSNVVSKAAEISHHTVKTQSHCRVKRGVFKFYLIMFNVVFVVIKIDKHKSLRLQQLLIKSMPLKARKHSYQCHGKVTD